MLSNRSEETARSVLFLDRSATTASSESSATVVPQTGSRHESHEQRGVSHFVRAMTSATGRAHSAFAKMRQLQRRGATIATTGDRQTLAFTLRCTPVDFPELKNYLLDAALRSVVQLAAKACGNFAQSTLSRFLCVAAGRCCYHEWELADMKPFIKDNLLRLSPEERVIDLVQSAFWFGPLSNSVYCEEARVDGISVDHLKGFVGNFGREHCTVASVGFAYDETLKLAEMIELIHEKPSAQEAVSYPKRGFEYYDLGRDSITWVAAAVQGCGTCDFSRLLKHSAVAAACGVGCAQAGQHPLDCIRHSPLAFLTEDPQTELRAFNLSYAETGVFGILARTQACTAEKATRAIIHFLSNLDKLSAEDIEIGKKRLKFGLAVHEEDCVQVAEGLALQMANNVQMDGPQESFAMVDSIATDDILATANEIVGKKADMAIAVVGDVTAVPLDVDLFKGLR
ncbi:unnamed protein product, partial [Iphiclides podalirius]